MREEREIKEKMITGSKGRRCRCDPYRQRFCVWRTKPLLSRAQVEPFQVKVCLWDVEAGLRLCIVCINRPKRPIGYFNTAAGLFVDLKKKKKTHFDK